MESNQALADRRRALCTRADGLEQETRAISASEVGDYTSRETFVGSEFYGSMLAEPGEVGSLVEGKIIRLVVRP